MERSKADPMIDGSQSNGKAGTSAELAEKEKILDAMLERLSVSKAHFAHLQRDAPDLTQQEKMDIAATVLDDNPATFLSRFGKFLQQSDLVYFSEAEKESYEVSFHLKEIRHRLSHGDITIKNRRYAAMQELEAAGDYFSEEAMKQRDPLLYEQMVGQFLTEEQREQQASAAIDRSDLRLSSIILNHIDDQSRRETYRQQKEREECQEEEEEEDSEEESDDDAEDRRPKNQNRIEVEEESSDAESVPEISDVRANSVLKQQMFDEFTAIMREQFLCGNDVQFDYSKVDENPDYDSLVTLGQDEEFKYFMSESPETVPMDSSVDDASCNPRGDQCSSVGDRNRDKCAGDKDSCINMKDDNSKKINEDDSIGAFADEEEDDYMLYEPPPDLVTKSFNYVKMGSWDDDNHDS